MNHRLGLRREQAHCRLVRLKGQPGWKVGVLGLMALVRRWKERKMLKELMVLGHSSTEPVLHWIQDPNCHLEDPKQRALGVQDTQLQQYQAESCCYHQHRSTPRLSHSSPISSSRNPRHIRNHCFRRIARWD